MTAATDDTVAPGVRYRYAIQAVSDDGRPVAQSRPVAIGIPPRPTVEVLDLRCGLAPAGDTVGCGWSAPPPTAEVVELWRSVDAGPRERIGSFRPAGPTAYREQVPEGASKVAYAVLAKDAAGTIVGRSRADVVAVGRAAPPSTRPVAEPTDPAVAPVTPPSATAPLRPLPTTVPATTVPATAEPSTTVPATTAPRTDLPAGVAPPTSAARGGGDAADRTREERARP